MGCDHLQSGLEAVISGLPAFLRHRPEVPALPPPPQSFSVVSTSQIQTAFRVRATAPGLAGPLRQSGRAKLWPWSLTDLVLSLSLK